MKLLSLLSGLLLLTSIPTPARAAAETGLQVVGDLAGTLEALGGSTLRDLDWQLAIRPGTDPDWPLSASVRVGPIELESEWRLPSGELPGSWRLSSPELAASALWPLVKEIAGSSLRGALEVTAGTAAISGEGTWTAGGEFAGPIDITLQDLALIDSAGGWEIGGFTGRIRAQRGATAWFLEQASLVVESLRFSRLPGARLALEAIGSADAPSTIRINQFRVSGLGGEIQIEPFEIDWNEPAIVTSARLTDLALEQVAALLPAAIQQAQGRVSGDIAIAWSLGQATSNAVGRLNLSASSPTTLTLEMPQGFLTGQMPETFTFLPAWLGPLSRWSTVENPAFRALTEIEEGKLPLQIESASLELFPDGILGERTLHLDLVARPAAGSPVDATLSFAVNVSGPLQQVLDLGLDDRSRIELANP